MGARFASRRSGSASCIASISSGSTPDVLGELERANLLVHAWVLSDPLNASVPEGMGAGVAVVATDTGGHVEYMSDGREVLLHRPVDTRALGWRAEAGCRRPGARERARELAPAPVARRWTTLYRALSGGRRMG